MFSTLLSVMRKKLIFNKLSCFLGKEVTHTISLFHHPTIVHQGQVHYQIELHHSGNSGGLLKFCGWVKEIGIESKKHLSMMPVLKV